MGHSTAIPWRDIVTTIHFRNWRKSKLNYKQAEKQIIKVRIEFNEIENRNSTEKNQQN